MPLIDLGDEFVSDVVNVRRDIHAHPEMVFDVERTAGIVAKLLLDMGCERVDTGIGKTGVVGLIRGRLGDSDTVIALRADMDALPIAETTSVPYRSTAPGVMHACGHDGHTAMLLGAARYLAASRAFDGTVALVFQPAEEGGAGSAAMLADGLMERYGIEEVYGMHNTPGMPLGRFAIRSGPIMAAGDRFTIELAGKGGHGAHPENCRDVVLAGAQIVVALQSIVSRDVDPLSPAVVSVCSMQAGNTFSVLPGAATLLGTVRTFTSTTQDLIEERIGSISQHIGALHGVTVTVDYDRRVPATVNHVVQSDLMAAVAREISGVDLETPPHMGGEDFSRMLEARPGAFIFMGNGASEDLHHPGYDFDDRAIPYGVSFWVRLVERRLATVN